MSSDNQYTALGPAIIGFQTNSNSIDRGAEIFGKQLGVKGVGMDQGSPGVIGQAGQGNADGVLGFGSGDFSGVAGFGGSDTTGTGVFGKGGSGPAGGFLGFAGPGVKGIGGGGLNSDPGPVGVFGQGGGTNGPAAVGVVGHGAAGAAGVVGRAGPGTADGVVGFGSGPFSGVAGFGGTNPDGTGVFGQGGGTTGPGVKGIGGGGPNTDPGPVGVFGQAGSGSDGVRGIGSGFNGGGVHGISSDTDGNGVIGEAHNGSNAFAIWGRSASGLAGRFDGRVQVMGDLDVTGTKSAVVPLPDGSHLRLYCLESPESWFEDFGVGQLANGQAQVSLDPNFAAVVNADAYHVYVTEYEDNNALYVTERTSTGFVVRAKASTTAGGAFSYRVVAKRKDIVGTRLEVTNLILEKSSVS